MKRKKEPNFDIKNTIDIDMDYEDCVLSGHIECQYEQNSHTELFGGHRSLISQFCGHDAVSTYMTFCLHCV